MSPPIIAAVDPSREDWAPVALGALFSRLSGAPLVVAAAFPFEKSVHRLYPEYARTLRLDAERAVRCAATTLNCARDVTPRVEVTVVPAVSSPAAALHELAERRHAEVLVIGSSRRGTVARALPDAVTDRLLHGAPCSVAVAPDDFSMDDAAARPRVVGAAFTDTVEGYAALAAACRLAEQGDGVVRVLTVAEPLDAIVAGTLDGLALAEARQAGGERVNQVLHAGLDAVSADRCGGGEVLSGHPAEALAAASADLDVIVCGSRGYGPLRTLLVGSTSHALVRRAACPVLVVPRGAAAARPAVSAAIPVSR
jgi:nucleotide-binding universal stress UspA family protein